MKTDIGQARIGQCLAIFRGHRARHGSRGPVAGHGPDEQPGGAIPRTFRRIAMRFSGRDALSRLTQLPYRAQSTLGAGSPLATTRARGRQHGREFVELLRRRLCIGTGGKPEGKPGPQQRQHQARRERLGLDLARLVVRRRFGSALA
jgi:hypothetical protein